MKYNIKQFTIKTLCLLVLFVLVFFVNIAVQEDSATLPLYQMPDKEAVLTPKELFLETWNLVKKNYWDNELNEQNWSHWKKRYLSKIKTEEDAYVAINSMLASLNDPYSKFLSSDEFREQNNSIDSKIYGIGINIASVSGKIYVVNVIKGAPADLGGVKPGDMILKINGNDVKGDNIFQTASYIKGNLNSFVDLEILRENKRISKKIKRAEIKIKTVESEIMDKEIGYIRIVSFISSEGPVEFIDAMNKVKDTNALILDLRGNTGGLFQNAVFVANMFLDEGKIVKVIGRGGHNSSYTAEEKEYTYDKPLIVLVDGESASASEIVSAALKDNGRAMIVGTKTFGKGVVQKVYDMPNNMGMNLTIARYLTPNGNDDFEKNNDSQLNFAKNMLRNEIERSKIAAKER